MLRGSPCLYSDFELYFDNCQKCELMFPHLQCKYNLCNVKNNVMFRF